MINVELESCPYNRQIQVKRTLRIFISNTASDQTRYQQNQEDDNQYDLSNGNAPAWTLKIEGRLLDVCVLKDESLAGQLI